MGVMTYLVAEIELMLMLKCVLIMVFSIHCRHIWDFHGKQTWANPVNTQDDKQNQNPSREPSAEEIVTLTKEDYANLQALLKGKSPVDSSTTPAHSGKWCSISQNLSS